MADIFTNPDYVLLTSNIEFTESKIESMRQYRKIYIGTGFTGKLDLIPHTIQDMSINVNVRRELGNFPPFLEILSTESKYQDYVGLPPTLKVFINKDTVTQATVNSLLYGLEYIYMNYFSGNNFVLPNSVHTIIFNNKLKGFCCPNPITQFPTNLKKLVLPSEYKYDLDRVLPEGLESLTISRDYSKPLNNLPSSLKHLYFHDCNYKQPLDNLPIGLETLVFDSCIYNESIDNLPDSIKTLDIGSLTFDTNFTNLPNGLENLTINLKKSNYKSLNNLPNGIKTLKLTVKELDSDECSELLHNIENCCSLKTLHLKDFQIIDKLPVNLKYLKVHKKFEYIPTNIITADLTNLDFVEIINNKTEQESLSKTYPYITFI